MIRYRRPDPPAGFPTLRIRRAQQAAEQAVAEGRAPAVPECWQDYKVQFCAAQHRKCSYCEVVVLAEVGAVDHYAPKNAVGELRAPGQERPGLNNVVGRDVPSIHEPGYWWLALEWSNWLFVCNRCNSGWKLTLFPVAEQPHPRPAPTTPYTPLLLHPLDPVCDPEEHLEFDSIGQIRARDGSPRGRATIETCGLDRPSLTEQRLQLALDVARWVNQLLAAVARQDDRGRAEAVRELRVHGDAARPFAGVVRSRTRLLLAATGWEITWQTLDLLLDAED